MEEVWYLEDTINGNPVWGLFETQLLRKQLLNSIAAGLNSEKIVDNMAKGDYISAFIMDNALYIFTQGKTANKTIYRAYLLGDDTWSSDPNKEISVVSNPSGLLLLADGDLNMTSRDCAMIRNDNINRHIICIDLKTFHVLDNAATFYTHDNRARPYKVSISNQVFVYKQFDDEPLYIFTPQKVFIGESPIDDMTRRSGNHGPEFTGNSILLKLEDTFIFIGGVILEFVPLAEIVKFVSPVGNNDVPYPYAVDEDGRHYLFEGNVILNGNIKSENPYHWYYDNNLITAIPPNQPAIRDFKKIREFYIGDEAFSMRYSPTPIDDYNRLVNAFGIMYVIKTDNKKYVLSMEDYVNINMDFGRRIHAQALLNTILDKGRYV